MLFVSLFVKFFYRRFRRFVANAQQEEQFDDNQEAELEDDDEEEEEEDVTDAETQPVAFLRRVRNFFQISSQHLEDSFRSFRGVIFGQRPNPAPPEIVGAELGDLQHHAPPPPHNPNALPEPSAPPPPYVEVENRENLPIIRNQPRGLANQNYGAMRSRSGSVDRAISRMEEIPLAAGNPVADQPEAGRGEEPEAGRDDVEDISDPEISDPDNVDEEQEEKLAEV